MPHSSTYQSQNTLVAHLKIHVITVRKQLYGVQQGTLDWYASAREVLCDFHFSTTDL